MNFLLFTALLPYFELYQGESASKKKLCRVYITKSLKVLKREMTETYGCPNDEAVSMKICFAKCGTKIQVFDEPWARTEKGWKSPWFPNYQFINDRWFDDWSDISVSKGRWHETGMGNNCEVIKNFELNKRQNSMSGYKYLSVTFNRHWKCDAWQMWAGVHYPNGCRDPLGAELNGKISSFRVVLGKK